MRSARASFWVSLLQLGFAASSAETTLCDLGTLQQHSRFSPTQGQVLMQRSPSASKFNPDPQLVEEPHIRRAKEHASKVAQWKQAGDAADRTLGAMARFEATLLQSRNATTNATVHANRTAAHNQTINDTLSNENRTLCRACIKAEQGLIKSLALARDEHEKAQKFSLALATAAKNHEASSEQFLKYKMEFQKIKQELQDERITYTASKDLFMGVVAAAELLHPTAMNSTKAESDMNMHGHLENKALEEYSLAAARAKIADEFVLANQTKETMDCAGIGLPLSPAEPEVQASNGVYVKIGTGHCRDASGNYPAFYFKKNMTDAECIEQCNNLGSKCAAYNLPGKPPGDYCYHWMGAKQTLPDQAGWLNSPGHGPDGPMDIVKADTVGQAYATTHCMKKVTPTS